MRREHILMIWIGGFVLAVALYLIGPDRFLEACWDLIDTIDDAFRDLVAQLGARTYGVVRAFAIAVYVVFFVLCVLASRRGHRGFWPLIVVTAVYFMLIGPPFGSYPAPLSRWMAALILVVVAAAVMTRRVGGPPPNRGGSLPPYPTPPYPPPPYPPGRAP
jgi:hypothetical protein